MVEFATSKSALLYSQILHLVGLGLGGECLIEVEIVLWSEPSKGGATRHWTKCRFSEM